MHLFMISFIAMLFNLTHLTIYVCIYLFWRGQSSINQYLYQCGCRFVSVKSQIAVIVKEKKFISQTKAHIDLTVDGTIPIALVHAQVTIL